MAQANLDSIITELSTIFPQHSQQVITYIHNDVVNVYGEMAQKNMVLPACIERLLELQADFKVPVMEQDMGVEAEIVEEVVTTDVTSGDLSGASVSLESTINSTINSTTRTLGSAFRSMSENSSSNTSCTTSLSNTTASNNTVSTPARNRGDSTDDSAEDQSMLDTTNDKSNSSSDNDHSFYRMKDMPKYRESLVTTISSGENSPVVAKDGNYFPEDDIDDVLLLEDLSTDVSQVRPKVLEDDDEDILEVSITVNRAKRKNEGYESTPDAKKRKSSSDSANGSINIGETIRAHVIVPNKQHQGATTSSPNNVRKENLLNWNQMLEDRRNEYLNSIRSSTIVRPATTVTGQTLTSSSTLTKAASSAVDQPLPKTLTVAVPPPPTPLQPPPPVLVDIANLKKGMKDFDHYAKKRVKDIINDVTVRHIESLIRQHPDQTPLEQVVTHIITQLLDDRNYPKEQKILKNTTSPAISSSTMSKSDSFYYSKQAIYELQKDFPKLKTKVLRAMFIKHKSLYTQTYKEISAIMDEIKTNKKRIEDTVLEGFLKGRRNSYGYTMGDLDPLLAKEIMEMKSEQKRYAEKADHEAAVAINNQQYEEDGQAIECGCCFMESSFDDMVQCSEGHLFCSECLRSYSKEAAFGGGKCNLVCMTSECGARFMLNQLQKALPAELLTKFQELEQNEALKLANIENLFTCPHCDFAAEVPGGGDKVFSCQSPTCLKETCMHCKEPWDDDHFGVPCKEMEKKDVTNLRKTYEEKMTDAKIRKCWQCKNSFLKESGCNKITCKCGAKMCYICRTPKIDYSHFCQHARDPGKQCTNCKQCSLWTDPKEDDDRAVKEIQKQAEEEKRKLEGDGVATEKHIGPKIDVPPAPAPAPKVRVNANHHQRPRNHNNDYRHRHNGERHAYNRHEQDLHQIQAAAAAARFDPFYQFLEQRNQPPLPLAPPMGGYLYDNPNHNIQPPNVAIPLAGLPPPPAAPQPPVYFIGDNLVNWF